MISPGLLVPRGERRIVTVGSVGATCGFTSGTGSISAAKAYGLPITAINAVVGTYDFRVTLNDGSVLTQERLHTVYVEDGAGVVRIYSGASVTFFSVLTGTNYAWQWSGSGSDPVWDTGDVGEQHKVTFY